MEITLATNRTDSKTIIGHRLKLKTKALPMERYVANVGFVTSPLYARLFDKTSAKQRAYDFELAGYIVEIEPVYAPVKGDGDGTLLNN